MLPLSSIVNAGAAAVTGVMTGLNVGGILVETGMAILSGGGFGAGTAGLISGSGAVVTGFATGGGAGVALGSAPGVTKVWCVIGLEMGDGLGVTMAGASSVAVAVAGEEAGAVAVAGFSGAGGGAAGAVGAGGSGGT